jgi:hypothetical protein
MIRCDLSYESLDCFGAKLLAKTSGGGEPSLRGSERAEAIQKLFKLLITLERIRISCSLLTLPLNDRFSQLL